MSTTIALWLGLTQASAGTGPWVLGQDDQQLYTGIEAQRFTTLAIGTGSFSDDVIDVDDGVSTVLGKLIFAYGLARGFEIEVEAPFGVAFANTEGPVCELLGYDACRLTGGIAPITTRAKWQVLDEVAGQPLSLSLGVDLRFGQPTAWSRQRITTLGDGTFDIEPRLAIGRVGTLPKGYWSIFLDASFRYRFPTDKDFDDSGVASPGYEVLSNLEALFTPTGPVTFGPTVGLWWRPVGVDFGQTNLELPDRFNALKAFVLEPGAKLIVRSGRNVSVSVGVTHTLYAINNPADVLKVSAGVAVRDLVRRRDE